MALREFKDSAGTQWRVWDVAPHEALVLRAPDPAASGMDTADGRAAERRPGVHPLGRGWLCFENDAEKRRLAPVPGNWHTLDDPQLEVLLADARRVKRREE